jgi:hypothetical protein
MGSHFPKHETRWRSILIKHSFSMAEPPTVESKWVLILKRTSSFLKIATGFLTKDCGMKYEKHNLQVNITSNAGCLWGLSIYLSVYLSNCMSVLSPHYSPIGTVCLSTIPSLLNGGYEPLLVKKCTVSSGLHCLIKLLRIL